MKRFWTAIIITALVSAYGSMVLQRTNGPKNIIRNNRLRFIDKHSDKDGDPAGHLGELATCPWCLAPWLTLPIWSVVSHLTGVQGWRHRILGYAASVALSAFIRHEEDRY